MFALLRLSAKPSLATHIGSRPITCIAPSQLRSISTIPINKLQYSRPNMPKRYMANHFYQGKGNLFGRKSSPFHKKEIAQKVHNFSTENIQVEEIDIYFGSVSISRIDDEASLKTYIKFLEENIDKILGSTKPIRHLIVEFALEEETKILAMRMTSWEIHKDLQAFEEKVTNNTQEELNQIGLACKIEKSAQIIDISELTFETDFSVSLRDDKVSLVRYANFLCGIIGDEKINTMFVDIFKVEVNAIIEKITVEKFLKNPTSYQKQIIDSVQKRFTEIGLIIDEKSIKELSVSSKN